jgi:hypothetical protein
VVVVVAADGFVFDLGRLSERKHEQQRSEPASAKN